MIFFFSSVKKKKKKLSMEPCGDSFWCYCSLAFVGLFFNNSLKKKKVPVGSGSIWAIFPAPTYSWNKWQDKAIWPSYFRPLIVYHKITNNNGYQINSMVPSCGRCLKLQPVPSALAN